VTIWQNNRLLSNALVFNIIFVLR